MGKQSPKETAGRVDPKVKMKSGLSAMSLGPPEPKAVKSPLKGRYRVEEILQWVG